MKEEYEEMKCRYCGVTGLTERHKTTHIVKNYRELKTPIESYHCDDCLYRKDSDGNVIGIRCD